MLSVSLDLQLHQVVEAGDMVPPPSDLHHLGRTGRFQPARKQSPVAFTLTETWLSVATSGAAVRYRRARRRVGRFRTGRAVLHRYGRLVQMLFAGAQLPLLGGPPGLSAAPNALFCGDAQDSARGFFDNSRAMAYSGYQTAIVWFREGENLRLHDNPVIERALAVSQEAAPAPPGNTSVRDRQAAPLPIRLLPIFIETPWDQHGRRRNEREQEQIRNCGQALAHSLRDAGSGLLWVRVPDTGARDPQEMAGQSIKALKGAVMSLKIRSLVAMVYPCGVTRLQHREEELLAQNLSALSSTQTEQAPGEATRTRIQLVAVQETANTLFPLERLPFGIAKIPDDCDDFALALESLGEPEDTQDTPTSWPPLPQEALDSALLYRPPGCPERESAVAATDEDEPLGEQSALLALEAYAKAETSLVLFTDTVLQTRSQGVLGLAMQLGSLSPRRFWHVIRKHLPETSIRRQCAWFDLLLHDFLRLLTWKRGVHPA